MKMRLVVMMVAVGLATGAAAADRAPAPSAASAPPAHVAIVNGKKITIEEYERTLTAVVRQKFYHRAPPEGQLEQVRREVAENIIDRYLLVAEAEARRLPVDAAAIDAEIATYEERYKDSPRWKTMREQVLPQIKRELREKQLVGAIEKRVREIPDPSPQAVRAFYDANNALFTEPEQIHASVILLKVDPSARKVVRDQARQEAKELYAKLKQGADFAELAKIRSGDPSARNGGDLGYLHRGLLPENLHAHMDALAPGQVGEPVEVLEGVAIFKVHERKKSALREFGAVQVRALNLLKRSQADEAWKAFLAGLRGKAVIEMNGALFPSPASSETKGPPPSEGATADPVQPDRAKEGQWPATGNSRGG